jgi:hypothetical protein
MGEYFFLVQGKKLKIIPARLFPPKIMGPLVKLFKHKKMQKLKDV